MQVPKSVRKARSSPENKRENELITRETKLSQEIDCEAKSRSKVRMQREKRSENSRKHKTIENGTARSGETTNKQKSLEVEEE